MSPFEFILLVLAGLLAGFINSVAGGGSLLTLPALIFLGIPATEANATNRIGVFVQSLSSTYQFQKKKIKETDYLKHLWPAATIGAVVGIATASVLSDNSMENIIAILMIILLIILIFKPPSTKHVEEDTKKFKTLATKKKVALNGLLFIIGFYGGFIQAGMGIFTLLVLGSFTSLGLMKSNFLKLVITIIFSVLAMILYPLLNVPIHIIPGIVLSIGQIGGSFLGTTFAVNKGAIVIKVALIIMTIFSSSYLLFFK